MSRKDWGHIPISVRQQHRVRTSDQVLHPKHKSTETEVQRPSPDLCTHLRPGLTRTLLSSRRFEMDRSQMLTAGEALDR